ncbi:hypothetical protein KsCSTR_32370 [Candidatus Kuenenia stuttgartiensis]|uniref:Uncharacterized protein n=1 Tax=Kuenenia stuttgartiensis TaxID=174633 RepID=Q1Q4Q5_KUEST|nr:hypothetical protein KsCSTR_32370 [Candidatus Kuenenia stuttgartiensis]CAJ74990.1 unknown protein [Candidatus Kuenenia stuttgartiensis]
MKLGHSHAIVFRNNILYVLKKMSISITCPSYLSLYRILEYTKNLNLLYLFNIVFTYICCSLVMNGIGVSFI